MDRSLFPNGVLVTNVDLKRTETTKAAQIMRNRIDFTCRGVKSGGVITPNLTNTDRVDIATFTGYTPRGDYIVGDVATYNVAMADSTSGVVNVVCAVYDESFIKNKPHESNGNVYPTEAEAAFRIVVYTQADFDNPSVLTPSDDNVANDAKDRCLVLGKVTATGGALTLGDIQSPTDFNSILYATPPTMAGVDIVYVDDTTTTGTGLLEYQYSAPNYELRWTAPSGSAGVWVSWSADGTQTVTDGGGNFIRVYMAVSQMATSGTFPFTENIEIVDLYGQEIPRESAEDELHRNKLGTGIVSEVNPHGLSMSDISGDTVLLLDEHQDVLHCNGIWKGSLATVLSTSVTPSVPYDTLYVNSPTSGDLFYINGKKRDSISNNSIVYNTLSTTTHFTEVYVTDEETVGMTLKASYPAVRTVRGTWIIDMSESYPAGSYNLICVVSGGAPLVYTFTWDSGSSVVLTEGDDDQVIRLYSYGGMRWIDLFVRCSVLGATDAHLQSAVATYTDAVTVYASVSWDDSIQIASVPYWYDGVALRGYIGYPPYSAGRATVDKRVWGTLNKDNMNDVALQELIYAPADEYHYSGAVMFHDVDGTRYNFQMGISGISLDVSVSGGYYYCRGQRLEAAAVSALTLVASKTHLVYADDSGSISYLNVTDSFSGDRQLAMDYLLGDQTNRKNISADYHATSSTNASPERGVPLYFVVTGGIGVTDVDNVIRNVNNVYDPWSVGEKNCAFRSLYAAIYYANSFIAEEIELTIRGNVTMYDAITQPSHVKVRGISKEYVVSLDTGSAAATGAWRLSSGSIVENVSITTAVGFGTGNYVFGLNTDVRIKDCTISADDNFIFGDRLVASVDNVVFSGNTVSCESLTAVAGFGATSFSNWLISENVFENTNNTANHLIQEVLNSSIVRNNTFTVTSGDVKRCISITGVDGFILDTNFFYIKGGSGVNAEIPVRFTSSSNVKIVGNHFTRHSSSASTTTMAVSLGGSLSNYVISNNTFESLNVGIYFNITGSSDNVLVDSNTFKTLETSMVQVDASNSISNLKISNNVVSGITEVASSIAGFNQVCGILFQGSGAHSFDNFSIESNKFGTLSSNDSFTTVYGVKLDYSGGTSFRNVSIQGNSFDEILYTGSYVVDPVVGIYASVDVSGVSTIRIKDNNIRRMLSSNSNIIGIYAYASSGDSFVYDISDNVLANLQFSETHALSLTNYGIYHDVSAADPVYSIIERNKIEATSYFTTSTATYRPTCIHVGSGCRYIRVNENIISVVPFSTAFYYYSRGVDVDVNAAIKEVSISRNFIDVTRGEGVYCTFSNPAMEAIISNNDIRSMYRGIHVNGDCRILDNKVVLVPGPDPSSDTDLPQLSSAIYAISMGYGLSICRNTTMTSSVVYTVDGGDAGPANLAYHIYAELNDEGPVSVTHQYIFDSNVIDLKSQSKLVGHPVALNGLYVVPGGAWTPTTKGHVVQVTNNSFNGGEAITVGALPNIVAGGGSEPYVFWGGDMDGGAVAAPCFIFNGNVSSTTNFGGIANISVDDAGNVTTTGSNYDAGLLLW